jgi:hypothetical protein
MKTVAHQTATPSRMLLVALGELFADTCKLCGARGVFGLATRRGVEGCREAVNNGDVYCDSHVSVARALIAAQETRERAEFEAAKTAALMLECGLETVVIAKNPDGTFEAKEFEQQFKGWLLARNYAHQQPAQPQVRQSETLVGVVRKHLGYNAGGLLDTINAKMHVNDTWLAHALDVGTSVIRDIREHRKMIDADMLVSMRQLTGIDIDALRHLMGDRRFKQRLHNDPVWTDARRVQFRLTQQTNTPNDAT